MAIHSRMGKLGFTPMRHFLGPISIFSILGFFWTTNPHGARSETPVGLELPQLTHSRTIAQHPRWLKNALRPAYAHFEWDGNMTALKWCQLAREAGANCIFGAGEMPAGTLKGKITAFTYRDLEANPAFRFPADYKLDYAWVKEFAQAAHDQGLKMVVYDGTYRTLDPLLVEHPEWRQRDAQGKPFAAGFGSWNSPYRAAFIARWVAVARSSAVDGVMVDMLFTGPTGGDFSPYTVSAFKRRFGVEPPRTENPGDPVWQRWIEFQAWNREEVALDLTESLHAVNPEFAVITNQVCGWIFSMTDANFLTARAGQCSDGLLEEMGWDLTHKWDRPWAWPLSHTFQNLYLRSRTSGGYGQMWYYPMNLGAIGAECASMSMLANGVAPAVVVGGNWPEMKQIWQETKTCEPWIEDAEPLRWMALHFSERALKWYAGRGDKSRYYGYIENVFGFFQVALELHLPVEIITDDDLEIPGKLIRYATVVLPDSACLSSAQAAGIERYENAGGGVVASYETGCYDESGALRAHPLLEALFGGTQKAPVLSASWSMPIAAVRHPILDHPEIQTAGEWRQGYSERGNDGILFSGPPGRLVGAVPLTNLSQAAVAVPLNNRDPARSPFGSGAPALETLVAQQRGRGRVAFFPIDIGRAYFVYNHMLTRRLIGRAIEWTASRLNPLETTAPMSMETVLYQKDGAQIVHLVNDISSFGRAAAPNPEAYTSFVSEVIPIYGTKVAVQGAFRTALLQPGAAKLGISLIDGRSEVIVPRTNIYSMVIFQP